MLHFAMMLCSVGPCRFARNATADKFLLGAECAGVVAAVGKGVTLKVGACCSFYKYGPLSSGSMLRVPLCCNAPGNVKAFLLLVDAAVHCCALSGMSTAPCC